MAYRSDISVDWAASPRIITVAAPSREISIQDLHDTMRTLEALPENLHYPSIIDSAGLELLGPGVRVGLTSTLKNAQLAFEARPGPTWELCTISGGNLVALDELGDPIDVRFATAYTTVDRTSSASATLQESADIQYSSFNGGVTVDALNGLPGTDYPRGTPRSPVDNLIDAMSIATTRGFGTIYVVGDLLIDNGGDYTGMVFIGESKTKTVFTISPAANVYKCEFYEANVTGTLDGEAVIKGCVVTNLNYISGYIEQCVLAGVITLGGGQTAHFLDCWSGIPGAATPTIDMAGAGQALAVRNYNGGIRLINKTGNDSVSIDLNSGQVILDPTVTAGTIVVRGIGDLTDNSVGATVITTALMNSEHVGEAVWANQNSITLSTAMADLLKFLGLDASNPVTISQTQHTATGLTVTITDNGNGTVTLTRQ